MFFESPFGFLRLQRGIVVLRRSRRQKFRAHHGVENFAATTMTHHLVRHAICIGGTMRMQFIISSSATTFTTTTVSVIVVVRSILLLHRPTEEKQQQQRKTMNASGIIIVGRNISQFIHTLDGS